MALVRRRVERAALDSEVELAEILRTQILEMLLEILRAHAALLLLEIIGVGCVLDGLAVLRLRVLRGHGREQRLRREDGRREAQGDGDAVGGPRIDVHELLAAAEMQLREVRVLLDASDL